MKESEGRMAGRLGLLLLVGVALLSTCRKWDNPLDPTGNHPPWVPANPHPGDYGFGPSDGLALFWESHDPDDGDRAYFAVAFGTDSPPLVFKETGFDTILRPTGVACSTRYYWQVKAYDDFDTVTGPVWRFQTVPRLIVAVPDTGEQLRMYTTDTIVWTGGPPGPTCAAGATPIVIGAGGRSGSTFNAAALAGADSTVVSRSTDDGVSWIRLGRATTPGQYVWEVPAPATESARVRVQVFAVTDTMTAKSGRFEILDTITGGCVADRQN